uniref:TIR domain-containing protein n=1 Tax=Mola mola TaxID=94237 RepID=A0A3Q3WHG5_MOLML
LHFLHTVMKIILLLSQLLPLVGTINTIFLPCDTDVHTTAVDCNDRPLKHIPMIKSVTVVSLNLSRTKIRHVGLHDLSGLPNLRFLIIKENCPPGGLRALENQVCKMEINYYAFKSLLKLQVLILPGNSLTFIPWLPESLRVLNLQNNRIFNIIHPLKTPHLEELYLPKNCFYANPCNQSFYISERVFEGLPKLKKLHLGYNNLTAIPNGLPSSLEILDLRENTITEVSEGAFANLANLSLLNMEWNCQRCDHAARPCYPCPQNLPLHLYPKSFYADNSSITFLSLRGNSLRTLPEGLFRPLKKLKALDLSDNLLLYAIQNGSFFAELTGLFWISLIYNYEPQRIFPDLNLSPHIGNLSGLQQLLLSGNFFHTLSTESLTVLSKLQNLKKLELRMNFIKTFDMKTLKQLPSLIHIILSQNMLNFLPCRLNSSSKVVGKESFWNQNLYKPDSADPPLMLIDRDDTSGSDILESELFGRQEMLQDIWSLSSVWDNFCRKNLTVDLSQNDIMYLKKEMFVGMENAVCLDLSFNYMSQALKGGVFDSMKNLAFLNLSYNRLDFYYKGAFSELKTTLKVLDLSNNEFHFQMRGMGHRLGFIQNLINLEVLSLANNDIGMRIDQQLISSSLKYLDFYGNHLDIMWESDNNKYTNFFHNLTNLTYLDISDNSLKSISPQVLCNFPGTLHNLTIRNNLLNFFPWQNISTLSNLCHLDLSQNFLSYLPHKVIKFGDSFSHLDLSHNRLSYIPMDFFSSVNSLEYLYLSHNQIKELNRQFLPTPFKNGSALKKLTLHANPFKCDCDTSWFADFLRTTPVEIPYLTTHIHCEYPESQLGESILSIDQRSCQEIYGSFAYLICSFLVVIFTVLPLLKHLYGWDLWYCLQVLWARYKGYSQLAGSDLNNHYHYDAFVVFDTSNEAVRDWVYNDLTVNLENPGHRRFCLCLEERDWIPGLSCIENLHNAVYSSVKTVFVLSSGVDAVVLILLDEMFPKMKYLQLRKRLCKKSVLSWPRNPKAQPLFWNQVRMTLSSDNLSFYDNNMSESFM